MTIKEVMQLMSGGAYILPSAEQDSKGNPYYLLISSDRRHILGKLRSKQIQSLFEKKLIRHINEETADGVRVYFVMAAANPAGVIE